MRSVSAVAFSSSANLGPGYDILALAHTSFFDRVSVREGSRTRLFCTGIPQEIESNTAGRAVTAMLRALDVRAELEIHIEKGIPYGLGLGSSGASAVGAVTAASELLGLSLSGEEIVRFAMQGEVASSGAAHPDNVAAATFGGAVAVLSDGPVVRRIPVHSAFRFLLIVPGQQREGKTRLARSLVPRAIETGKYVRNSRRLASLILGLSSGDRELLREGMNDEIVEPSRSPLFPFYWRIKEEALALNAAGVCVSGAGPSILVIFDERTDVSGIERRATSILESFGMSTRTVRAVSAGGAAIEEPGIVS